MGNEFDNTDTRDSQAHKLAEFLEWRKMNVRDAVRKPMKDKKKAKARAKRKRTGR